MCDISTHNSTLYKIITIIERNILRYKMMMLFALILASLALASSEVVLVSFDGVKETTSTTWTLTDDPGESYNLPFPS